MRALRLVEVGHCKKDVSLEDSCGWQVEIESFYVLIFGFKNNLSGLKCHICREGRPEVEEVPD